MNQIGQILDKIICYRNNSYLFETSALAAYTVYFVVRVKVQLWTSEPTSLKVSEKWVVLKTITSFQGDLANNLKK